jgi:hypothetical protein
MEDDMDTIASGESRVPMNHKANLKALSSRPRNAMSFLGRLGSLERKV